MEPLHRAFIRQARRQRGRFAMADARTPVVSYIGVLTRSILLGQKLRSRWSGQEMVGLLMPPSVPGACLNIAALLCGKIPVNLNYTASQDSIRSAIDQCGIKTVITARAFIEKVKISIPGDIVYLEDLGARISFLDKAGALLKAWLYPVRWIERSLGSASGRKTEDLATVIFSSGSTGEPKGIMLSHDNIHSNVDGAAKVLAVNQDDRIMGILPFFHSFGFMGTLWFPLLRGFGAAYHPNPMDARAVGELISRYRVTLLTTTPTFLQIYLQRVEPSQFKTLKYVIAGAEKLPERLASAFEEKFGVRPFEGYGCTECSPVVAFNVSDVHPPVNIKAGSKRGSIGQPMPGISVRIVHPETFEPLPAGRSGLLLVKGPNVMMGYLGRPAETATVMKEGWYITGDVASADEDGFLYITDRLSRFSKIGGEMVPHIKIEEKLQELSGMTEQSFAVAAVPDEQKGEKLIVLHTLKDEKLIEVLRLLQTSDLPNLWIPKSDSFFRIESLPVLGTGKLDLVQIKQLASKMSG